MATNSHESRVESVIEEQIYGLHIARKKSTETTRTTSTRRKVKNNRDHRRAVIDKRREVPSISASKKEQFDTRTV
jgi:hypothetical protein